MTVFTDKDLERLKEREQPQRITKEKIKALLARLEAAERYVEKHYQECEAPGCCELYEAHRQASGRDR